MHFPKHFIEAVGNIWGEAGRRWLGTLPDLVTFFQHKWNLKDLQLSPHLSHHLIVFAVQDGMRVVLKLSPPGKDFEQEVKVLRIYNGQGVVKLLDFELERGAMLQEAILPGTHLKKLFPDKDDQAIEIAVKVMQKIHGVKLEAEALSLPKIEVWLAALHADYPEMSKKLITRARRVAFDLINSQGPPVLLHGDLHHENVLQGQDDWTAIDPKGVIGEAAYEVGAFIRNPIPELFELERVKEIVSRRCALFASFLNIDKQRLIDWSFVQAVLAACWACEDNLPERKEMIRWAEILAHTTG